jgi:phage shock protein A
MAQRARLGREMERIEAQAARWEERARLAVERGREDLAREALVEKKRWRGRADGQQREMIEAEALVSQYQDDIRQLEQKLAQVREKQRSLVQRHLHATHKKRAQQELRRADSEEVWMRFESLHNRVERMEAEAELVNYGRESDVDRRFSDLERDEQIEAELDALKQAAGSAKPATEAEKPRPAKNGRGGKASPEAKA